MKNIKSYITEKLHLKTGIQTYVLPEITDSDETFVNNYMDKTDAQQSSLANKIKNKDNVLKKYVAALKVTGSSMPIVVGDCIYSQPYNLFNSFGDRALTLGWKIKDIQMLYNNTTHIKPYKTAKAYNSICLAFLSDILPNAHTSPNGVPVFSNNEPEYNDKWTKEFMKHVVDDNILSRNLLPHSYIVKIKGKDHIIETITTKNCASYFNFWVDGKKCLTRNDLVREIDRL